MTRGARKATRLDELSELLAAYLERARLAAALVRIALSAHVSGEITAALCKQEVLR